MAAAFMAAEPARAQTTAAGPYYAEPTWDQTLPSSTRFIILSNFNSEAVLDRNTGLVWERSPATTTGSWPNARLTCANKHVGGQKGWRLPSAVELLSPVDPANSPPLPTGHPFQNLQTNYWAATTVADTPTDAYWLGLLSGQLGTDVKTNAHAVWCVCGPMNEKAY